MKWVRLGIPLVVAAALTAASLPAGAWSSTAVCTVSGKIQFSPGLGATSQVVEWKSEKGPIRCIGSVGGSPVTGPGAFREWGSIEGTALAGTGEGTSKASVPTVGGLKKVSLRTTFTYGPGVGVKQSDSLVGPFPFSFYPTAGDGVNTPVTEIAFVGEFTLRS